MDPEAAAALRDVDDAGNELGDLFHECGELVNDDHERWRRFVGCHVEHVGEIFRSPFHHPHASVEFGAQRGECAQ